MAPKSFVYTHLLPVKHAIGDKRKCFIYKNIKQSADPFSSDPTRVYIRAEDGRSFWIKRIDLIEIGH